MAKFTPGVDTDMKAEEPLLEVLASDQTPLPVGKHVFQLVVYDDAGNESAPAHVTIVVRDSERPTAVVDALDDRGNRIAEPEVTIPFGRAFRLTGERSSDVGGAVRTWTWTLLRP